MLTEKRDEITAQMNNMMENHRRSLKSKERRLAEEEEKARDAKAQGDVSENAEYQIARDNCSRLILEIAALESTILEYEKYSTSYTPTGRVQVGSTVKLLDNSRGSTVYIKLYPHGLGNAKIGAVSVESPVGRAILGKAKGTKVIAHAPRGDLPYTIEEVL